MTHQLGIRKIERQYPLETGVMQLFELGRFFKSKIFHDHDFRYFSLQIDKGGNVGRKYPKLVKHMFYLRLSRPISMQSSQC